MRGEYGASRLDETDMAPDPFSQLERWLDQALTRGVYEPSAMVLATIGADGVPRSRTVLLKGLDMRGLGFFTNRHSQKGRDLISIPLAAAVFPWYQMERQVTARGSVTTMTDAESDAYWWTRPRESQIGAWASEQSSEIPSREALVEAFRRREAEFDGVEIPRPPHWGGFRLVPTEMEFWQGGPNRLHDRLVYRPAGDSGEWRVVRLSP